ncbi:DUF4376 domain-containing protein [Xanthobacter autotrophicus]|uniref:DUF4376 domain-containing protein n=1 Tax=Xanthobacter TaxID=279 RepID=UPI0024AAA430|nr:DUF4376 domain-containing protein [Xanthobacter autotrophicus]MDI4664726.1 DUF4376 domain-containing protein [Xanthobacter autotrophicus]
MRVAFHADGICTRILHCAPGWEDLFPGEVGVESDTANIGDLWDGAAFTSPPAPPAPEDLPRTAEELLARAAACRTLAEGAGVEMGGSLFASDLECQTRVAATLDYLARAGKAGARWKSWGGYVDLTVAQIEALGLLVGAHVEACFAAEEAVGAAIVAGSVTTFAQVDAAFAAEMGE